MDGQLGQPLKWIDKNLSHLMETDLSYSMETDFFFLPIFLAMHLHPPSAIMSPALGRIQFSSWLLSPTEQNKTTFFAVTYENIFGWTQRDLKGWIVPWPMPWLREGCSSGLEWGHSLHPFLWLQL